MADKFTRFLTGVGQGLTNPKGNLGDARHAARLYIDNSFARSPRTKFMYHVNFDINKAALRSPTFSSKHAQEVGVFVKNADLPRFTIEHDIKNQYNKKKVIYKDLKFEPLNIVMHDDSIGIINALWGQYWGYYSNERFNPDTAWNQRVFGPYKKGVDQLNQFRYGLDADGVSEPFFKSITLYTLSRKKFNSYRLINPHIVSWNHGNVDQSQSTGLVEASMSIAYESVIYGTGTIVKGREPKGFATLHYDQTPSPLSIGGGTLTSVFGMGGLIQAGSEIVTDAKTIFGDPNVQEDGPGTASALQTAIKAINFYKSVRSISSESLKQEGINILTGGATGGGGNLSSLPGISFGKK